MTVRESGTLSRANGPDRTSDQEVGERRSEILREAGGLALASRPPLSLSHTHTHTHTHTITHTQTHTHTHTHTHLSSRLHLTQGSENDDLILESASILEGKLREVSGAARPQLYMSSHFGHPTRGCIPRALPPDRLAQRS